MFSSKAVVYDSRKYFRFLKLNHKKILKHFYFEAHDSKTSKFVKNTRSATVVFSTLFSVFDVR